jgi:predicted regulator of Ras-like GTPase activity (Roadblock/LC7/MglB family)
MPVVGSLAEMPLATLVETNCRALHSARLSVSSRGQQGYLYFSDGEVVHVALGNLSGEAALHQMLQWTEGNFVLENEVGSPEHTIHRPWSELLLEAMQLQADWHPPVKGKAAVESSTLARLKQIEGVAGVVSAGADGSVLEAEVPSGNGEVEAAMTVFLATLGSEIGQSLQVGPFEHGVITQTKLRVLVLQQREGYLGLLLNLEASPAMVLSAVRLALAT